MYIVRSELLYNNLLTETPEVMRNVTKRISFIPPEVVWTKNGTKPDYRAGPSWMTIPLISGIQNCVVMRLQNESEIPHVT